MTENHMPPRPGRGETRLGLPVMVQFRNQWPEVEPENGVRPVKLVFVLRGGGRLFCDETPADFGPRDIFVIPAGVPHHCEAAEELDLVCVSFDPQKLPLPKLDFPLLPGYHTLFMIRKDDLNEQHGFPRFSITESHLEGMVVLLRMMRGECEHQRMGANFRLLGLFMALLGNLAAICPDAARPQPISHADKLGELVTFMDMEFHRRIDYDELLDRVPMSRSTLNRTFLRATGETPMRYLLNLRLAHAAKLLSLTDMPIAEVAAASGFEDSNYFSRAFRKAYRVSPRGYRAMPIPVLDC